MELLEYQAKGLFHQAGIPILPSERIDHLSQLKRLKLPYPVALKSQVRGGGRGKAGGVRFVDNTIDAIAVAQTLFGMPIHGQYPAALLAEVKYRSAQEYYLAIVLDRSARRPLLLGSAQGGIEIESQLETIHPIWIKTEFSPYYARQLALRMGLSGDLLLAVADVVERMYKLFVGFDLDLIEINPLGVGEGSEVMALDGKVVANPDALQRHPQLIELLAGQARKTAVSTPAAGPRFDREYPSWSRGWQPSLGLASAASSTGSLEFEHSDLTASAQAHGLDWVELPPGNVAILGNGAGLTLAMMDLVSQVGGKPVNFLDIGSMASLVEVDQGLSLIYRFLSRFFYPPVQILMINLLGIWADGDQLCETLIHYQSYYATRLPHPPHVIARLVTADKLSTPFVTLQTRLQAAGITAFEELDAALLVCEQHLQQVDPVAQV